MAEKFNPLPPGAGSPSKGGKTKPSSTAPVLAPPAVSPPASKSNSVDAALKALAAKHPYYSQFIPLIKNAAKQWTIDPVQLMQVLIFEGAKANSVNSVGAKGLAQVVDTNVDSSLNPSRYNEFVNQYGGFDPLNPTWAVNYMAWRMDGGIRHYPTLDDWYRGTNGDKNAPRGYNPGFAGDSRGPGPSVITKSAGGAANSYTPTIPQSPTQTGGKTSSTSAATKGFEDPYVVGVSNQGKLITKFSPDVVPKNAIQYDGQPITLSAWKSLARSLDSYFVSYTGGRPSNSMLAEYVKKGWSPYSLTVALSKSKGFQNSPIYKKFAPAYTDASKDILAPGEKVPPDLLRSGIVNGWDTSTMQAVLRQRPQYVQSNEFKGNTAALLNVHASIMGNPDEGALNGIKQAALAGWDANQYAAYLRSQPQYVQSPEYQTKALSFLSSLGLITGENAVLKKGQEDPSKNPNPAGFGPLPDDKRVGAGTLTAPEDTVATYGG